MTIFLIFLYYSAIYEIKKETAKKTRNAKIASDSGYAPSDAIFPLGKVKAV